MSTEELHTLLARMNEIADKVKKLMNQPPNASQTLEGQKLLYEANVALITAIQSMTERQLQFLQKSEKSMRAMVESTRKLEEKAGEYFARLESALAKLEGSDQQKRFAATV